MRKKRKNKNNKQQDILFGLCWGSSLNTEEWELGELLQVTVGFIIAATFFNPQDLHSMFMSAWVGTSLIFLYIPTFFFLAILMLRSFASYEDISLKSRRGCLKAYPIMLWLVALVFFGLAAAQAWHYFYYVKVNSVPLFAFPP